MTRRDVHQTRIPNMPAIRAALLANVSFRMGIFEPLPFAFVVDASGNFVVDVSGAYLIVPAAAS